MNFVPPNIQYKIKNTNGTAMCHIEKVEFLNAETNIDATSTNKKTPVQISRFE